MTIRTNIQITFSILFLTTGCMNQPLNNDIDSDDTNVELAQAHLGMERSIQCDDNDPCTFDTFDRAGSTCLHEPMDMTADGESCIEEILPSDERCEKGSCEVTHPQDCLEILENNPNAANGTYVIDPDGNGRRAPIEVTCDMVLGGWTALSENYRAALAQTDRKYLYTKNNTWILSPATTQVWSWNEAQMLPGDYFYGQKGFDAEGFIACDVPALAAPYAAHGIGCFLVPTDGWKVFPNGSYDAQTGLIELCQNSVGVFNDDYCTKRVQIWERRDI